MAKDSVLNEEMRRKTLDFSSWSKMLVTKNRGRRGREKSRSKFESKYRNMKCHYYYIIEHIQKHCFLWKKKNKGKKGKSKEKDHDNDDDCVTTTTGDDLVILRDFESVNLVFNESMCIIDSSATLHVTPKKDFFTSCISGDFEVLKMSNDGVSKVISDVCLQTNIGVQLWLKGVKYGLDVRFNLIFVHILDDGDYDNHFGYGKWKLTKALVAKDNVNAMICKKDMLLGLKNVELEKYSHCMVGKQIKISFNKHPPSRKSKLLELMHFDTKDQVLEKFKQFQALVERQSVKKRHFLKLLT
ncbi:hypothetical protein CR513_52690, partial [Mucuna pruriens]